MKKSNNTLVREVLKQSNRSIRTLTNRALKNDAEAAYFLGLLHLNKTHTLCNISEGITYLNAAEKLRFPAARYALGVLYTTGKFVEKDAKKGFQLMELAATALHPDALSYIGMVSMTGNQFTSKNIHKGLECLSISHEKGCVDATYNLGICYYKGIGVDQDILHALKLLIQACEQGNASAKFALSHHFFKRGSVLSSDDILQACTWLHEAANVGHAPSALTLAKLYYQGTYLDQNFEKACFYFYVARASLPSPLANWLENGGYGLQQKIQKEATNLLGSQPFILLNV